MPSAGAISDGNVASRLVSSTFGRDASRHLPDVHMEFSRREWLHERPGSHIAIEAAQFVTAHERAPTDDVHRLGDGTDRVLIHGPLGALVVAHDGVAFFERGRGLPCEDFIEVPRGY